LFYRELDPMELAPRIASATFLIIGLLILGVDRFVPSVHGAGITLIAGVAAGFGLVGVLFPWPRFTARAQLVLPIFAFVLFAWGGVIAHQHLDAYLALLPLPFVFIGFTQRPGTSIVLAPAAVVGLLVAARFSFDPTLVATLLVALPMSVAVGEAVAQAQTRRTWAEQRVDRLLQAVRVLGRMEDERTGAEIVASLAAELLGADAVAVLLADRPGGRRYRNRAFFGHPALGDAAPLLIDALGDDRSLRAGKTRFISHAETHSAVRNAAIVPLPGHGSTIIGLIVALWGTPRRRLPPSARQAAELLSEEAGRMFQRLRDSAALTHDAETDPLTELANRRTFARALETMRPDDALVIVDLDHFKSVNDRFGHQAGDEALRALAACLRSTTRQVDCVARYGGEEFALVLPDAGADGARLLLDRVRHSWRALDPLTTFSAGIAVHRGGVTPRETLREADGALYAAKENGRDRDEVAAIVLP
jgi:two-component system cell cycle response regulator